MREGGNLWASDVFHKKGSFGKAKKPLWELVCRISLPEGRERVKGKVIILRGEIYPAYISPTGMVTTTQNFRWRGMHLVGGGSTLEYPPMVDGSPRE